jgi:hypothetical protein
MGEVVDANSVAKNCLSELRFKLNARRKGRDKSKSSFANGCSESGVLDRGLQEPTIMIASHRKDAVFLQQFAARISAGPIANDVADTGDRFDPKGKEGSNASLKQLRLPVDISDDPQPLHGSRGGGACNSGVGFRSLRQRNQLKLLPLL